MSLKYDPDHVNSLAADIGKCGESITAAAQVTTVEPPAGNMPAVDSINDAMKRVETMMKQFGALMGETDTQIVKMMANLRKADKGSGG